MMARSQACSTEICHMLTRASSGFHFQMQSSGNTRGAEKMLVEEE
jgi:hypothetical protein